MHSENAYLTLTYSDDHVPHGGTLVKHHFQDFIKRYRERIAPTKIRYFHCGEYGDELGRPHYHAAIFGHDFPDKKFHKHNEQGDALYTSQDLDEIWGKGHCWIGNLEQKSAAYIARYIFKKVTGDKSHEHYTTISPHGELQELSQEYITCSNRPGIGFEWFKKFKSDVFPSDFVAIMGGGTTATPGYYVRLLEKENAQAHEALKRKRAIAQKKLAPDNTFRRLEVKEKVKKAKISTLKRKL